MPEFARKMEKQFIKTNNYEMENRRPEEKEKLKQILELQEKERQQD